jgi:hypothetical protein
MKDVVLSSAPPYGHKDTNQSHLEGKKEGLSMGIGWLGGRVHTTRNIAQILFEVCVQYCVWFDAH